jgi:hypothetical protein
MTRIASMVLVVGVVMCATPLRAQPRSGGPESVAPRSGAQVASKAAWRVPARLVIRTRGGHLDEPEGVLVSDSGERRLRFEEDQPGGLDVAYDRLTSLHYEDGAKYPNRWFNKHVEFHLTIRYSTEAGPQGVSTVRLDKDDAESTLERLKTDTGLAIDRTPATRSFRGVPIRVVVGDRVSVTDDSGQTMTGRITELSESSLTLVGAEPGARVFDEATLRRIRLPYLPRRTALVGFGIGAAVGGAYAVLACAAYGGCGSEDVPAILAIVGIGGGVVAGVNVAIGALRYPSDQSKDVYLGGAGARPSSSAAMIVRPMRAAARRGFAVYVTY